MKLKLEYDFNQISVSKITDSLELFEKNIKPILESDPDSKLELINFQITPK